MKPFMHLQTDPAHSPVPARRLHRYPDMRHWPENERALGTAGGHRQPTSGELFKSMAGVNMVHVPYQGSGAAIPDVLGGHLPLMFDSILSVLPHVKSGRLIALAVSTVHHSPVVPGLPTVAESGLPGFDVSIWFGVLAPANTPGESSRRSTTRSSGCSTRIQVD